MTREEVRKELEDYDGQGFSAYIDPLDAETASEFPCENCSSNRVYGVGRKKGKEYHCWAICPDCGESHEF